MWLTKVLCFFAIVVLINGNNSKPPVYVKISQSPDLSQSFAYFELNELIRASFQSKGLSVFVPTNEAFQRYSGEKPDEVLTYHIVWVAKRLKDLESGYLTTMRDGNPPLWVTKVDDDIYVNNARIIPEYSDYQSEDDSVPKKLQVLHVIDEVLNPVPQAMNSQLYNPTAFEYLSQPQDFGLKHHKLELFYGQVKKYHKEDFMNSYGGSTFFIPVDESFTDKHLELFDGNVIEGHIIPNRVLFTRPSPKDTPFQTVAKGDHLRAVVLLLKDQERFFVKSRILVGDSKHPAGEQVVEILKANIPVKNGVVHLIQRPFVVFDRKITNDTNLPF